MESAPKTARPQKRPATAPLNVCVYKVTGRAGDVWSSFEGSVAALWQIQLDHNAHQSVLFNLRDALSDFLRQASADKEGYPNGLDGLLNQGGVKLVLADKNDPEGAGFIQWRAAFYVAGVEGAVKNFFMLLDDFFVWKMKALQKEVEARPPFHTVDVHLCVATCQVHIYQRGGQEIDGETVDEFSYGHYTLHDAEDAPPLKWFECSPAVGKKIVMMHIQPESETCVSVLWSGNTWNFRNASVP